MNKYKEAYQNIYKCNCEDCTCESIRAIGELVELATPKEALSEQEVIPLYGMMADSHNSNFKVKTRYFCPKCKRQLKSKSTKYCDRCGQRIGDKEDA